MLVLLSLLIVIILLFTLIYYLSYKKDNNIVNDKLNNDVIDNEFNEEELFKLGNEEIDEDNVYENFSPIQYEISKEDYHKLRNDNFNNQFFNFFNRLNNSSDNVDNSVERINRFRNSKFGLTEDSAIGMKIKDVADYLMKK